MFIIYAAYSKKITTQNDPQYIIYLMDMYKDKKDFRTNKNLAITLNNGVVVSITSRQKISTINNLFLKIGRIIPIQLDFRMCDNATVIYYVL